MSESAGPFGSIEDTQEFVALLEDAIEQAILEVQADVERAGADGQERRTEALNLALYKLGQLSTHVTRSRRILNDLRSIRRLLANEREMMSAGAGPR
jgi:hypothetical protein